MIHAAEDRLRFTSFYATQERPVFAFFAGSSNVRATCERVETRVVPQAKATGLAASSLITFKANLLRLE